MSVPTERERVIAELHSKFSISFAFAAELRKLYNAGYKAGHDAAIEQAAKIAEGKEDIWNLDKNWNAACNEIAAAIRALKPPVEAEEKRATLSERP